MPCILQYSKIHLYLSILQYSKIQTSCILNITFLNTACSRQNGWLSLGRVWRSRPQQHFTWYSFCVCPILLFYFLPTISSQSPRKLHPNYFFHPTMSTPPQGSYIRILLFYFFPTMSSNHVFPIFNYLTCTFSLFRFQNFLLMLVLGGEGRPFWASPYLRSDVLLISLLPSWFFLLNSLLLYTHCSHWYFLLKSLSPYTCCLLKSLL